ncbi:DUF803-domain-containing protein [Neoconidiobolus thromboides FSU 785]|nr:DUF803-domain-containing protein [Neoconidiobolus thromboides FSU 785]
MNFYDRIQDIVNDPVNGRTLIGVLLSVVGNILISVALNIQKYAHNRIQQRIRNGELQALLQSNSSRNNGNYANVDNNGLNEELEINEYGTETNIKPKNKNYLKSKFWWLGYILMNLGEVGNLLAYGFAPASTVAPLGTVGLISNALIAPFFLGEKFRKRDFFGILLAMSGAIMVVMTSKNTESNLPEDGFFDLFFRSKVMIYIATCICLMALFLSISDTYGKKFVVIDISTVALFGGFTVLATKGVSSLLNTTGILQVKYLNKALQSFDSTVVIPTQFVLFTLSAVIGSAILFDEFEAYTLEQYITFIFGCLLTFVGVYLIASERGNENQDKMGPLFSDGESTHSRESSSSSNYKMGFGIPIGSKDNRSSSRAFLNKNHVTGLASVGLSYS